jgi:hypothetical protein
MLKKLVLGSFVAAAVAGLVKLVGAKRVRPTPPVEKAAAEPAYAPNPRGHHAATESSHHAATEASHKPMSRKQRKRAARHRQHAT